MTKHTPGPWRSHTNGSDFFVTANDFHGANGKVAKCYVADVQKFRNESGEDECQANANLIAAAPELLKCVEMLAAIQPDNVPWWFTECHDMAVKLTSSK